MDKSRMMQYIKKSFISIITIALVTVVSIMVYNMGIRAESILMLYTFGILIIIMETREYIFGIISSFLIIGIFNYFFTEPRYTLRVYDKNYFMSFFVFLIVSIIVTSLTIKIQKQVAALEKNQRVTDTLYKISSGYLHVSGQKQVAEYGIECLQKIQDREYIIFVNDRKNNIRTPYYNTKDEISEDVIDAAEFCFQNSSTCGKGMLDYTTLSYYMIPIISKEVTFGVMGVECKRRALKEEEKKIMEAVTSLIAIAMDRESSYAAEQESKFLSERERLRNNLLRSISHDLRTPLSGITGSASFLLESYDIVDVESRNTLLRDILNDSIWLSRLVDNLLNMTRIQEGRLTLNYQEEVVDDVASEVSRRVGKRLESRTFLIETPKECLSVPMDGSLIIQVLVNLVDNAIKHTKEDGEIHLVIEKYVTKGAGNITYARFAVTDNGTGIEEKVREHMFDSFVTTDTKAADSGRGIGLGLSIASEIVHVHNGLINGYNNEESGATIYFLLPLERCDTHE